MSGNNRGVFSACSTRYPHTALAALSLSALLIGVWAAIPAAHAAHRKASQHAPAAATRQGDAAPLGLAQIIAKNIAARGGLQKWRTVHALSMTGTMDLGQPQVVTQKDIERARQATVHAHRNLAEAGLHRADLAARVAPAKTPETPGVTLPFALEMKRPHKTRLEIVYNKQTAIQVFDGENGWKLRPFTGRHEAVPLSANELKAASAQEDLDGLLIDYAAKGTQVALEQSEPVDGHPAYRLKLTLKNGETRHVWIDAKTFLEARVDTPPRKIDGIMRTVSTYYSHYKSIDGLMIPFVVETRVDRSARAGRMLIEKVKVNPALDDSRFSKPA